MSDVACPFDVGDEVVFTPDHRTIGWHQHSFERWGLYPGYRGAITDLRDGVYVIVDDKDEAAMHWSQFSQGDAVSEAEAERLRKAYDSDTAD